MKLKALSTAMILATVPMTGAFAAALDRSANLLQPSYNLATILKQVFLF